MIKSYMVYLVFVFIFLTGCATHISQKPFAYQLLYQSVNDAGNKIVNKENSLIVNKKIGFNDLNPISTNNSLVLNIVRDGLIDSFVKAKKNILERDYNLLTFVARENYNLKLTLDSKYINNNMFNTYLTTLTIVNNASLSPLDLIIAYRIIDIGVEYQYQNIDSFNRIAKTSLFYEIVSPENAQVLSAGIVVGTASDEIKKTEKEILENSNLITYSYPFEKQEISHPSFTSSRKHNGSNKIETFMGLGFGWEKSNKDTIDGYPINLGLRMPFEGFSLSFRVKKYKANVFKTSWYWNGFTMISYVYKKEINDFSGMLDVEYNIFKNKMLNGYLFIGGGLSHLRASLYSSYKSGFGFNGGCGANYSIYKKIKLYFEYEYFSSSFIDSNTGFNMGVTFNF